MTAKDGDGHEDSISKLITITNRYPSVSLNVPDRALTSKQLIGVN